MFNDIKEIYAYPDILLNKNLQKLNKYGNPSNESESLYRRINNILIKAIHEFKEIIKDFKENVTEITVNRNGTTKQVKDETLFRFIKKHGLIPAPKELNSNDIVPNVNNENIIFLIEDVRMILLLTVIIETVSDGIKKISNTGLEEFQEYIYTNYEIGLLALLKRDLFKMKINNNESKNLSIAIKHLKNQIEYLKDTKIEGTLSIETEHPRIFDSQFAFNFFEKLNKNLIKFDTQKETSQDVNFVYTMMHKKSEGYIHYSVKPNEFKTWLNKTYPDKFNLTKIKDGEGITDNKQRLYSIIKAQIKQQK